MTFDELAQIRKERLEKEILHHRKLYNEGRPSIDDALYDLMEEHLRELDPNSPVLNRQLTPVDTEDWQLPFALPSLRKIRPDNGASEWLKESGKFGFVVSGKLDGLAALVVYREGKPVEMYSSSDDGFTGKNISHMIAHIKGIPQEIDFDEELCVRLELIISKKDFAKVKGEYKNARNLAAGIKNKTRGLHKNIGMLQGIALQCLSHRNTPAATLNWLQELGFKTVKHKFYKAVDSETLSSLYDAYKEKYQFEVDGLVIEQNIETPAPEETPKHQVAFKDNLLLDSSQVEVIKVTWETSRYNRMTPLVWFNPVELEGTTVQKATGHNAKFIKDNRIGEGAVVTVIKSGSIIPKIEGVVTPSKKSPFKSIRGRYYWNESGVDIYANEGNEDNDVRHLAHFFGVLGVDGLRLGSMRKVYTDGFNSEKAVMKMTEKDWVSVLGVNGSKIHASLRRVTEEVTLPELAYAWGGFGRGMGRTKLWEIYNYFGSVEAVIKALKRDFGSLVDELSSVVGPVGATAFAENLNGFFSFVEDVKIKLVEPEYEELDSNVFEGWFVAYTGFRDKETAALLEANGAVVQDGVKKDTTLLVIKEKGFTSSKVEAAIKKGVKVVTKAELDKLIKKELENE